MSDTVIIHGHSDDLIEVEGAISAELSGPTWNSTAIIEFNTGHQFKVSYDGDWHVEPPTEFNDLSKAEVLDVGESTLFNDYTEVCIYQSWDELTSVEVINDE